MPKENVSIQNDGKAGSKVFIAEAQNCDAGWYQCTAYNIAGSACTRARLQVDPLVDLPLPEPQWKLKIPQGGRIIEKQ